MSGSSPRRDRAFAREWETQPERGFPTLAKENIATTKTAIKQYAELVARGGWPQLQPIELRAGMSHPAVVELRRRLLATAICRLMAAFLSSSIPMSRKR